jgi:CHAP domain
MAPIDLNNGIINTETIATLALQIAQGQVGQSENPVGSNSGPMVNEYLKAVGLNPGYAWCQAFVYWCYEEATKKLNLPNPVIKTGGVHDCWNRSAPLTKDNSKVVTRLKILKADSIHEPTVLKPGSQFILSFGGETGHTGIVEKIDDAVMHTIEGNSNTNGSREGYEVVRHQRNLSDKALQGFIVYSS